jgi:D-xylose transport system permease protein
LGAAVAAYAAFIVAHTGFPVPVIVLAAVAGILSFLLRWTKFGRQIYAIGGNREACRLAGINITNRTFVVFALMGLMYAVAGIILAGRLGGAPPNGGLYLELDAIAAAVIGGTSLMGGVGTVGGAVLGALFMETIRNGMSLMNVATFYQYVVSGVILILAVSLDVAAKGAPRRARFATIFRLKG